MDAKTRRITVSALMTALTVAFLYLASVSPRGQLGLVAAGSLFAAAALIECGKSYGTAVFAASALLGLLVVPDKTIMLYDILFFGYYPVVKSLIEQIGSRYLRWILKLAVFNAAMTAAYFLFKSILLSASVLSYGVWVLYLAGNIIFILFDIGFTKVIGFYMKRISGKISGK